MNEPLTQPIYIAPIYNPQSGTIGQPNIYYQQQQLQPQVIVVQQPAPLVDNKVLWIILAIFLGGIGTMIAASSLPPEKSGSYMCIGIIQVILFPLFCIGWIWAIVSAVQGYP